MVTIIQRPLAMDKTKSEKRPESLGPDGPQPVVRTVVKPLTFNNVLYYYYPIIGTASYTLLSVNVLNPMLRFSFLTKRDLTNFLLVNSILGVGCHLYSRPHLKLTSKNNRIGFASLGSVLFSFSSVLLWAFLRSLLPENVILCSAAGVASSYILVQGATYYLDFVDSKICH